MDPELVGAARHAAPKGGLRAENANSAAGGANVSSLQATRDVRNVGAQAQDCGFGNGDG